MNMLTMLCIKVYSSKSLKLKKFNILRLGCLEAEISEIDILHVH